MPEVREKTHPLKKSRITTSRKTALFHLILVRVMIELPSSFAVARIISLEH